jgi:hypothetical protein
MAGFSGSPVNDKFERLDPQESVKDKDLTAPPASPTLGDRYIVASVATAAWVGMEKKIAEWTGLNWKFITPTQGFITTVEDEGKVYTYTAAGTWVELATTIASSLDTDDIVEGPKNKYSVPYIIGSFLNDPPVTPDPAVTILISTVPTGAWVGKINQLTRWNATTSAWDYWIPVNGQIINLAYVGVMQYLSGSALWISLTADDIVAGIYNKFDRPESVLSIVTSTPPASPTKGDAHLIAGTPTGAWAGKVNNITVFSYLSVWVFWPPVEGMRVYNVATGTHMIYSSGTWVSSTTDQITEGSFNKYNYPPFVLDRITAPPATPTIGDTYLVWTPATGAWVGKDYSIARWNGTTWIYWTPVEGAILWIDDENKYYVDGIAGWQEFDTDNIPEGAFNRYQIPYTVKSALATPPGSPSNGDTYLAYGTVTGDFVGHENHIARWSDFYAAWIFWVPFEGMSIRNEATTQWVVYTGSAWATLSTDSLPEGSTNKYASATNVAAAGAVMDGDFTPAEGYLRKTGTGTYTAHKSNLSAAVPPAITDDSVAGYSVGSIWIDTTGDMVYQCVDSSTGAAVWQQMMTAAQSSKLGGIEAGADVTDATNVAAAGALMSANLKKVVEFATLTGVTVGIGTNTSGVITADVLAAAAIPYYSSGLTVKGIVSPCTLPTITTVGQDYVYDVENNLVYGTLVDTQTGLTGVVDWTNGSATLAGSTTSFTTELHANDYLLAPDSKIYKIASIESNTSLTLSSVYLGTTATGIVPYEITYEITLHSMYHGVETDYLAPASFDVDVKFTQVTSLDSRPLDLTTAIATKLFLSPEHPANHYFGDTVTAGNHKIGTSGGFLTESQLISTTWQPGESKMIARVNTTDATPTVICESPVIAVVKTALIEAKVVAREQTEQATYKLTGCFYRDVGGNVTQQGSTLVEEFESDVTWDADFQINTTNQTVEVLVTGKAGQVIDWKCVLTSITEGVNYA